MQVLRWIALGCGTWFVLVLLAYALFYPLLVVPARCAQDEEDMGIARRS